MFIDVHEYNRKSSGAIQKWPISKMDKKLIIIDQSRKVFHSLYVVPLQHGVKMAKLVYFRAIFLFLKKTNVSAKFQQNAIVHGSWKI